MIDVITFLLGFKAVQILTKSMYDVLQNTFHTLILNENNGKWQRILNKVIQKLDLDYSYMNLFHGFMAVALLSIGWNFFAVAAYILIIKILYQNEFEK